MHCGCDQRADGQKLVFFTSGEKYPSAKGEEFMHTQLVTPMQVSFSHTANYDLMCNL